MMSYEVCRKCGCPHAVIYNGMIILEPWIELNPEKSEVEFTLNFRRA